MQVPAERLALRRERAAATPALLEMPLSTVTMSVGARASASDTNPGVSP